MNFLRNIAKGLVICSIALLPACDKEEINETGTTTTPTLSTRGGLAFHVVDGDDNNISGATINIALSESELNTGTYLATRQTDGNGRADFGMLNAGNYYYRASITINSIPYSGSGVVQVQSSENLTQELTLE